MMRPTQVPYRRIRDYLSVNGVKVTAPFQEALDEQERKTLELYGYGVLRSEATPGMPRLLQKIACSPGNGVEQERSYCNALTELLAFRFCVEDLGCRNMAIESPGALIHSPHRRGDKSCDFRGTWNSETTYFEVKDCCSEVLSEYQGYGATCFMPMEPNEIGNWIVSRAWKAASCGANYLICRVPVWVQFTSQRFEMDWLYRVFKSNAEVAIESETGAISLRLLKKIPEHFKGIFIVKRDKFIELRVRSRDEGRFDRV